MAEFTIAKSLNKAYRQTSIDKSSFETFKNQLKNLYQQVGTIGTEEALKVDFMDFLKLSFYGQNSKVSPSGRIDCAIHLGNSSESPIGVIFEVKTPTNVSEMISRDNLNRKAMQELLLYYLQERVEKKNIQLKQLIVTNVYEFFVFDAQEFERVFYANKSLVKRFVEFSAGTLTSEKTDFFYKEIASPAIDQVKEQLNYTWFDIRKYKDFLNTGQDKRLGELYKVFSPEHLLKERVQNDSNALNHKFYNELLYIIGLEEVEDKDSGGKRIITRCSDSRRNQASILENTITILDKEGLIDHIKTISPNKERNERLFDVALALSIHWINRILFLKLLEAQLLKYHKGDASYAFLRPSLIPDYDELNKLFFQVLAIRPSERSESINEKFGRIPYLNSSLFEMGDLERMSIRISNLDNSELPIFSDTVLKDEKKPRYKQLPTLRYLLEFLDAYDFSNESKDSDEQQTSSKTLIKASVLGLIFEKINGHRDGSVFTPGWITMYISRELIQETVVQKFNKAFGWSCADYKDLKNKDISDCVQANEIIDSIRICDPAVGSGHFLVSALNEIIYTKYDLNILMDSQGGRIKKTNYGFDIENDELVISEFDGEPFSYIPGNAESQRIQEAVFNEKRRIIENSLFGVDVNTNAVNICRLRLWIELLKHTYYTKESDYVELETLPNIDINIKEGNSLLQRFDFSQDISGIIKNAGGDYKDMVWRYKNAHSKKEKLELGDMIGEVKTSIKTQISQKDPKVLEKTRLEKKLADILAPKLPFPDEVKNKNQREEVKKLREKISKVQQEIDAIKNNKIFVNAFEWRIEFPEVWNEVDEFEGFDIVIGNPPYIQLQKMGDDADALQKMNYLTYERTGDIYCLFYERGWQLLKPDGLLCYITSNKWMRAGYGEKLRKFLVEKTNPKQLIDFAGVKIFESATVDTNILLFQKSANEHKTQCVVTDKQNKDGVKKLSDFVQHTHTVCNFATSDSWVILSPIEQSIKRKIEAVGTPLKDWDIQINYGIKTGFNDAFIINTDKRNEILNNCADDAERARTDELIRPILRGRDIKRYGYDWADLWLIATFPSRHYDIEKYPAVQSYLLSFAEPMLRKAGLNWIADEHLADYCRQKLAQTGNFIEIEGQRIRIGLEDEKARKKTSNKWFETQDSISYWEDFLQPHICWKAVGRKLAFALVEEGTFLTAPACFISAGQHSEVILNYLCSKVGTYFIYKNSDTTGAGDIMLNIQSLIKFPVPQDVKMEPNMTEEQINSRVFSSYGLTQDEIDYIESRI